MSSTPHASDLSQTPANYAPLSPLRFLERAARVYPQHPALIHGDSVSGWAQTYARCRQLASALAAHGVVPGDTVSVLAPNIPPLFEAHYAVPMCGAVLNAINTRLDADTIRFILEHGEAKVLITDSAFSEVVGAALKGLPRPPLVIDIHDVDQGQSLGANNYESFVAGGDPDFPWLMPQDEWRAISLNYTSGTTGNPKGVVYHHRGAYLNALSNALGWSMEQSSVYLWTLPMFHCNGWCFPWTLAALGATSVCLRKTEAAGIFTAIAEHGVSHFCGAPIVLNLLLNASDAERRPLPRTVSVMTAAAPPPPVVLAAMERMGFHMTHVYGLTETYGPATLCAWHKEWDQLPAAEQAALKSRQGVPYHVLEGLEVMDADHMQAVDADGKHLGEVMFRGNIVMKGYLKDAEATAQAFRGGWFHSGDLGVMHDDQYLQLKDRSKDIIISGGENISSIEIEEVLYRHPAVLEAAAVARPDDKWGETPCAFVALKAGVEAPDAQRLIEFCRDNMAHYKAPRTVVFRELPKTSTGKIQKFKLRALAEKMGSLPS